MRGEQRQPRDLYGIVCAMPPGQPLPPDLMVMGYSLNDHDPSVRGRFLL